MRKDLWGSHKGILIVCFILLKLKCSSVFVWTGIFSKTLLAWTWISFYADKKDAFSKISGYVWTRSKITKETWSKSMIFKEQGFSEAIRFSFTRPVPNIPGDSRNAPLFEKSSQQICCPKIIGIDLSTC